jgi:hypothetical protein
MMTTEVCAIPVHPSFAMSFSILANAWCTRRVD